LVVEEKLKKTWNGSDVDNYIGKLVYRQGDAQQFIDLLQRHRDEIADSTVKLMHDDCNRLKRIFGCLVTRKRNMLAMVMSSKWIQPTKRIDLGYRLR